MMRMAVWGLALGLLGLGCETEGAAVPTTPDVQPADVVADVAPDSGGHDVASDPGSGDVAGPDTEDAAPEDVAAETTGDALSEDGDAAAETVAPPTCEPTTSVVTFQTDDGVTLEADLHTAAVGGGGAVVLLHMIPPHHDRTNYPPQFRAKLVDHGLTVVNVDRRGAGGSGGVAQDAFLGPNGKLDAKAAVDHLATLPCAPDPNKLVVIGASNGTTTMVDYTVWAHAEAAENGGATPAGLVYLTGGLYTEAQNSLAANADTLGVTPSIFLYSTSEKAWSEAQAPGPDVWQFKEYNPGAHGTNLFSSDSETMDLVADWVAELLGG